MCNKRLLCSSHTTRATRLTRSHSPCHCHHHARCTHESNMCTQHTLCRMHTVRATAPLDIRRCSICFAVRSLALSLSRALFIARVSARSLLASATGAGTLNLSRNKRVTQAKKPNVFRSFILLIFVYFIRFN